MEVSLLPSAILLFVCSTWFVLQFAKRSTSLFVMGLAILSFGSGLAAVIFLPIDLSYASVVSPSGTATNTTTTMDNPTYLPWQITYWTTFFLAWIVLPITRETLHSGKFYLLSQLKDGITITLRSTTLLLLIGIVFAIAVVLSHSTTTQLVSALFMTWGNTYGLVLVSLLLGNGLVGIPKKYWRQADPNEELRRIRIVACGVEEELFDAVMNLEDVEQQIEAVCSTVMVRGEEDNMESDDVDNGVVVEIVHGRKRRLTMSSTVFSNQMDDATQFSDCLELLVQRKNQTVELHPDRRTERRSGRMVDERSTDVKSEDMDMEYLVNLNAQLKRAQERVTSAQLRWDYLMEQHRLFSMLFEESGDSSNSDSKSTETSASSTLLPSAISFVSTLRYRLDRMWMKHLRYYTYRLGSILTATLSIFVLLGEVTLAAPANLSPFSWILHSVEDNAILFQIAALIPLSYMSICVYTCLFQMSILGPYRLRGNRQSHGVALVFNAQFLVRLQFPLAYNFLLILKYDTTACSFHSVMSDMATIPFFGTSFTVYAPMLILAVCTFTLCDAYPKLLHVLGIEHEDALLMEDQDTLDEKVHQGKQLLTREAERRNNDMGLSLRHHIDDIRDSSGKMTLVPTHNLEIDDDLTMDVCCRGRYSDESNTLV